MSDTVVIACSGLEKTYTEGEMEVEVLKGVELSVAQGENIAIIGASGSGKSTLLHLLGGLDRPTSGEVTVAGKLMSKISEKEQGDLRNRTLGFVYQFHHLLGEFTAAENVAMPLLIRGMDEAEAREQAIETLGRVGLGERVKHKPGELSGGERQRAAIARALVTKPRCVLADEPTGNLDEDNAKKVFEVMLGLNGESNVSLVMVTHNMELTKYFDRVKVLHNGILEDHAV